MTLNEAIQHCLEVAENCEEQAKQCDSDDRYERHVMHENAECATEHRQLAEWLKELKEAKRLLKAAMEDMKDVVSSDSGCRCCKGEEAASCAYIKCWTWRYADEAMKLLEEE